MLLTTSVLILRTLSLKLLIKHLILSFHQNSLHLSPVCYDEVTSEIHELKSLACMNIYEIISEIVKETFDFEIVSPLHFAKDIFPPILKSSTLINLYIKKVTQTLQTILYQFKLFNYFAKSLELASCISLQIFLKNEAHRIITN